MKYVTREVSFIRYFYKQTDCKLIWKNSNDELSECIGNVSDNFVECLGK